MAETLVLLLYSQSACLQHWRGKQLIAEWALGGATESRDQLAKIIDNHKQCPITVVIDTADEELRTTLVPKVTGGGRRQLLQRTLAQAFPNTEYKALLSQGTVRGKRPNEQVLLLAITQSSLLTDWLAILAELNALVQRVTTASMVLTQLARRLGEKNEYELIVYRHHEQGLRQLFLHRGQPSLSRLSVATHSGESIIEQFSTEATHTRQYLNNSKAIPRDAALTVLILHRDHMAPALSEGLADLQQVQLRLQGIRALADKFSLKLPTDDLRADHLLGWLAASYPDKLVDFSPATVRHEHRRFLWGQWAVYAAVIATAAMLVWSATELFAVWEISKPVPQQRLLLSQWQQLEQDASAAAIPSNTPPLIMKQAIELIDQLNKERHFPDRALRQVASALADYPQLRFRKIEWASPNTTLKYYTPPTSQTPDNEVFNELGEPVPPPTATETLFLELQIEPFNGDYLSALIRTENAMNAIKKLVDIRDVQMVSAPLNVNSQHDFSEQIELGTQSSHQKPQARFQLLISLESTLASASDHLQGH